MTRGVEEDSETRSGLVVSFPCARSEHLSFGMVEIVNVEVEVRLLRPLSARPDRRFVVRCELERQRDITIAAELHPPVVAVVIFNIPARDGAVEGRQRPRVTTIESDDAKSSDLGHVDEFPISPTSSCTPP